jgi:hypothetical protein
VMETVTRTAVRIVNVAGLLIFMISCSGVCRARRVSRDRSTRWSRIMPSSLHDPLKEHWFLRPVNVFMSIVRCRLPGSR